MEFLRRHRNGPRLLSNHSRSGRDDVAAATVQTVQPVVSNHLADEHPGPKWLLDPDAGEFHGVSIHAYSRLPQRSDSYPGGGSVPLASEGRFWADA